jgi:hypothetical protein
MNSYQVFGGVLSSELEFPELDLVANGTADWTLRVASDSVADVAEGTLIGEDRVDVGVMVRAYRLANGYRLAYEDTGVFDVCANGRDIVWHPSAAADREAARLDVLGRVLALALHASGWLSLHGSAVALAAGAVAFLAPKGNGKSTLAFALMKSGAPLMTDDTVVIDAGPPPIARPGVQSVRLFRDSADRLDAPDPVPGSSDIKATFGQLAPEARRTTRAPLAALYLLESVEPGVIEGPVQRERVAGPPAVFGLLGQTKIGTLLGGSEAAKVFDAVVAVAESTPVYHLRVAREYDQLDAVVEQITAWHAATGSVSPALESAAT